MKKIAHLGLGILKLLGLIVLVMAINGIPMLFLARGQDLPVYIEILLVLAYLVLVFFAIRTLWRRYQTHISKDVKVLSFSWGDFGKALLFFLVARVVAVVGTYLNILLTGQSTTSNDNALQSLGKIMSVNHIFFALLYVVTVAIIAPVIEELVFRGFATIFFFEKDQKISAAIITSIIFALPHISKWTEFPLYFAMGLVLYAAFARRENLKDSIAVHILNNTPAALVMLLTMFQ
ncbi:CAAX protease [Streptococcus sp. HMSC071H03]|uniref:CPBP family intramembrane glutamic endopeptidase n=2 Tax=Streptococcus anginosus TaxID=1328 RepID=A0AAP6ELZ4_STRAP|nr:MULTISPECIES: CPBP family intramembrane glutamic endopeptidase [Streptococcus]ALL03390.1 Membrane-bound protease, CAAX family [Streptococcus anginosus]MDU6599833.1 CPBP family intramembrane glutamic endopeptidase [Streptococcus anginosus]MDX5040023.1 CPBP family intramembrane glutamic endopeptidase [Streptococcus anginosus]OFR43821.1 CAAX protease [Streptococcus sp. HMSC071H03]